MKKLITVLAAILLCVICFSQRRDTLNFVSKDTVVKMTIPTGDTWYYQYPRGPKVDTVIRPYVDLFLMECKIREVNIRKFYRIRTITFSVLPDNISGVCYSRENKVYLDLATAKGYSNALRLIIFHELGHCVLGLSHIPMDAGVAIMNPELDLKNINKYYNNWEAMLLVLFGDNHPKIKDANDCCPDMVSDPCTHKSHKH